LVGIGGLPGATDQRGGVFWAGEVASVVRLAPHQQAPKLDELRTPYPSGFPFTQFAQVIASERVQDKSAQGESIQDSGS
jgi:hypothetical protein